MHSEQITIGLTLPHRSHWPLTVEAIEGVTVQILSVKDRKVHDRINIESTISKLWWTNLLIIGLQNSASPVLKLNILC